MSEGNMDAQYDNNNNSIPLYTALNTLYDAKTVQIHDSTMIGYCI